MALFELFNVKYHHLLSKRTGKPLLGFSDNSDTGRFCSSDSIETTR